MIEVISKSSGGGDERKTIGIDSLRAFPGSWISLISPTAEEVKYAADIFGLKEGNLNDALDAHESPRIDHDSSHGYVYIRWPQANKDGSTTTHPLLIAYGKDLVTVAPSKLDIIDAILKSEDGLSNYSPKNILLKIAEETFAEYEVYIKGHSDSIKKIVTKMRRNRLESEDFIRFVLVEEQINNFLSSLNPVVPLLRRLSTSKHLILTENDRDMIEDVVLSVEQSIHICTTNISRIASVREAYAALSNNSLNRTMKALTAATFFIALPNVIFGMYGMNISLPIQHSPWAFVFVISSALVAILTIALIAKRRRWF